MKRFVIVVSVLGAIALVSVGAVIARQPGPSSPLSTGGAAPLAASSGGIVTASHHGVEVRQSDKNDESPRLRDITPKRPKLTGPPKADQNEPLIPTQGHVDVQDPVVQRSSTAPKGSGTTPPSAATAPVAGSSFDGMTASNAFCNCAPPDTNGQVGSTQYVQIVNAAFQVFDKVTHVSLYGPAATNTIWTGFGGPCETRNDGDPIALYDQIAGRWLVSQFTSAAPYYECIAISTTGDATGSYYRYAFQLSSTDFPDYPHLGVWPDGYYMTTNWFSGGRSYAGPRPYVFDRARMIAGQPATFQSTSAALGSGVNPMLPSDLDGSTLPPAGAANVFAEFGSILNLYDFHVDWTTPGNTTFTKRVGLPVAGYTTLCATTRNCIAQPGTSNRVDGIGDRLMHRLAYRNFGDHDALVVNHSVDAGGGQAGVRWYEIRNPLASTASIYQQGTYAPGTDSRWMGSVALDKAGDIGVAYSISSSTTFPSLNFAGRLPTDPLGMLGQPEATLFAGTGSQTSPNRWGDYSSLTVDPTDGCTFWYTNEYYATSGSFAWNTRIGSFSFPGCATPATPTSTPGPTNTPGPPTATSTPAPPTSTPTATSTPVPDFSLSANPTTLSVRSSTGGAPTSLIAVTRSGAVGSVTLSFSGGPAGVTGAFRPNPETGSGSTLTVTVPAGTARGTYSLTVTGKSAAATHAINMTLTVTKH